MGRVELDRSREALESGFVLVQHLVDAAESVGEGGLFGLEPDGFVERSASLEKLVLEDHERAEDELRALEETEAEVVVQLGLPRPPFQFLDRVTRPRLSLGLRHDTRAGEPV